MKDRLPPDTELTLVYDQSVFIAQAIGQVRNAALLGGLLAILVLYAFLRDGRATFVIGVAIPVSVVGTFLLMYMADVSLNIMSLGGIALAVGMLVDNSIVVLENIVRKKEQGLGILESARRGASEVAGAVTAATLTTVAVFFPMVFVTGIAGQLFRDQALTVTFALLFSLLVALTLIPMLASRGAPAALRRYRSDPWRPPARFTRLAVAGAAWLVGAGFGALARLLGKMMLPLVWIFQGFYRVTARVPTRHCSRSVPAPSLARAPGGRGRPRPRASRWYRDSATSCCRSSPRANSPSRYACPPVRRSPRPTRPSRGCSGH
jgi:hydrophobic/amphiphilic exporter-1 (mainly G- bacteria), HAE1 family